MPGGAGEQSGGDIFQNEGATTPKLRRRPLVFPKWSAVASQKSRGAVGQQLGAECQAPLLKNRAATFSIMRGRRFPNCVAAPPFFRNGAPRLPKSQKSRGEASQKTERRMPGRTTEQLGGDISKMRGRRPPKCAAATWFDPAKSSACSSGMSDWRSGSAPVSRRGIMNLGWFESRERHASVACGPAGLRVTSQFPYCGRGPRSACASPSAGAARAIPPCGELTLSLKPLTKRGAREFSVREKEWALLEI